MRVLMMLSRLLRISIKLFGYIGGIEEPKERLREKTHVGGATLLATVGEYFEPKLAVKLPLREVLLLKLAEVPFRVDERAYVADIGLGGSVADRPSIKYLVQ
jgi:hypothetical protein